MLAVQRVLTWVPLAGLAGNGRSVSGPVSQWLVGVLLAADVVMRACIIGLS